MQLPDGSDPFQHLHCLTRLHREQAHSYRVCGVNIFLCPPESNAGASLLAIAV
jgi:hypothetical protein